MKGLHTLPIHGIKDQSRYHQDHSNNHQHNRTYQCRKPGHIARMPIVHEHEEDQNNTNGQQQHSRRTEDQQCMVLIHESEQGPENNDSIPDRTQLA